MNPIANNKSANLLLINTKVRIDIIDLNNIVFIEANRSYSKFYDTQDKITIYSKPLKYFEAQLNSNQIIRCHRSFMVNKSMIIGIDRIKRLIILTNNKQIPVSKAYYANIIDSLDT